jgi:3-deoxy-manno-octulosonate cytidylyltransferase (CMP-KDO synthetase)
MNILAVIPARMGSTRFPGKPLEKILGMPMIGHVYERVSKCELLTKTIIATCNQEIVDYIHSIGGQAIMTSDSHDRASDRCAEALGYLEKADGIEYNIVVIVQGDEPMIHPDMIAEAVTPMIDNENILVTNLLGNIESVEEFEDRNCIKVVIDLNSDALYFSREPIPTKNTTDKIQMKKQVCVIPFRRDFLYKYTKLEPTPLEILESVDMMRVLEHGFKVKMIPTKHVSHAVDTPQDLKKVESLIRENNMLNKFI